MTAERKLALRNLVERWLLIIGRSFDPVTQRWIP